MTNEQFLHAALIGQPGGRSALNTPALVLDLPALQRNIARMAALAAQAGMALRPHAKTHKSAEVARLQIAAGAVGVCCAKLGEAEALAAAGGVDSILITSPVVTASALTRLARLHATLPDLALVVDHPDNVMALAACVVDPKRPLPVLIDIDPGIHRTGVTSPEAAVALASAIASHDTLSLRGVQFYCGREQHTAGFEDRRQQIVDRTAYLKTVLGTLADAGHHAGVITGGGTGSHAIDLELGVLTELQAGSYTMMDRQYRDCALTASPDSPFETALFVDATVISANTPGIGTLDAGYKALASDGGQPTVASGAPAGAAFVFMGDEHGGLIAPGHVFAHTSRVSLVTPHCDPTVNLYDSFHVVDGDTLTAIWPVTARGRSR